MVSQPPDSRPTPRPPFNNGTAWLAQSGFFFVSIKTQFLLSPFLSYFELVSKNPFVSLFVCIHQTALFVCVYIKNTFPFPLLYIKEAKRSSPTPPNPPLEREPVPGLWLAAGTPSGTVVVCDPFTGDVLRRLERHQRGVGFREDEMEMRPLIHKPHCSEFISIGPVFFRRLCYHSVWGWRGGSPNCLPLFWQPGHSSDPLFPLSSSAGVNAVSWSPDSARESVQ